MLVDSCLALDSAGSSGQVSPTKRSPLRGVSLGRRLLKADGLPKGIVKAIEQLLISCSSSDMFVAAVVGDEDIRKEQRWKMGLGFFPTLLSLGLRY